MMRKNIRVLFERLKKTPFPELGKVVGEFALYDSLMAGTVSSFLNGANLAPSAIPAPDHDTEQVLKVLKKKTKPTEQETEFLKYAHELAGLRAEIAKAISVG